MITVTKTPFSVIVLMMIIYIVVHAIIGVKFNQIKKEREDKPGNEEIERNYKWLNFLFKWFPAMYVVIVVLVFYF